MIEYSQKQLPSQASFWNCFWRVLSFVVCSQARTTPLALITTALDAVAKARSELFGSSTVYISPAFPHFIEELHSSIRTHPQLFGLTKEAKAVVAAFLCHPVWQSLVDDALTSEFCSESLRTDLQHLGTIKDHHGIEAHSPYRSHSPDQTSFRTPLVSSESVIAIRPPSPVHLAPVAVSENCTNDVDFPLHRISIHTNEASPTTISFPQPSPWPTPSIEALHETGIQEDNGFISDDPKRRSDTDISSPPLPHVVIDMIEERKRARWARLLSESSSKKYR